MTKDDSNMKKEKIMTLVIDKMAITVVKKQVKNLNLSVHAPEGSVKLSVPHHIKADEIRSFITSKLPWIYKQQDKIKNRTSITPAKPLDFATTEYHYFAGERYYFKTIDFFEGKQRVEISVVGEMVMFVNPWKDRAVREKLMKEFYRDYLKGEIPGLVAKWEPIMGVKVAEWGVKQMKTRWGSCNIQAKRIWLNLELAKKSADCLEYIVVHEMTHLLEKKHSSRFYQLMDTFLPHWRESKEKLSENQCQIR